MVKRVLDKISEKYTDQLYAIFRILAGFLFFQHGAQKLFGWFSKNPNPIPFDLGNIMWYAGVIEVVAGILILLGLFTRYAAVVAALEMFVAYFYSHVPKGYLPPQNGGELAVLYFAIALVLLSQGSRAWSLERGIFKKEH